MELRVVVLSGVVVATLTLVMAVALLAVRWRRRRRERRRQQFLAVWEPLLFGTVDGDVTTNLPAVAAGDLDTFLSLWNHLQESVTDGAARRLTDVAHRLGVPRRARRLLARRNLRDRLLAIVTLGHLRERSAWTALATCASSAHALLSITAARALIQIDASAGVALVVPLIASRSDWPASRVSSLIEAAGPDVMSHPLAEAAIAAGRADAPRLIRHLDSIEPAVAASAIRRIILTSADKEVLTAALRVVSDPQDLGLVRRFLDDARWEVRVQAIKALTRLGSAADEELLAPQLMDAEWWVRHRAAEALCALLGDIPGRLDRLHRKQHSPFARDALAQARAEARL